MTSCPPNAQIWLIVQWQQQYMVNINLDLQLQQQYIVIINLDLQWQQQYMVNINLDLQLEQQYMVNINLDFAVAATIHGQYQPRLCSGSYNTWSISTLTYSGSYNTWSISSSTLQRQLQYTVNINHDLSVAAAIYGQYQHRPIMM